MFAECDEFSLRIVVSLAEAQQDRDNILEKTKIPQTQLDAILDLLIQSQIIARNGDHFELLGDPAQLSIYDILNRIKGWQRFSSCPLEVEDHSEELCPLHRRLENVSAMVERQLRASSIASLMNDPNNLRPLCNKLQV